MTRKIAVLRFAICGMALAIAMRSATADAPTWMHAAANVPLPTYDAKTNAVLLYSEDVTTVMPDGKMKGIERRVYKILRPEGRDYAVAHAHVGHDTHVGSMRGWCIPKSGKDYEVKDKDAIEKTVEGFGELVTDIRVRTLPIPAGE